MKVKLCIIRGFLILICIGAIESAFNYKSVFSKVVRDTLRDLTSAENLDLANIFTLKFPDRGPLRKEYDFIIVGSGPAGCVIANRLSENGKYSVLILEAGGTESPFTSDIPISSPNLQSTNFNWGYLTTRQNQACLGMVGSRCHWPHGKVLGGSSILYYMIYTRGNRRDFDNWERAGNPGWSWRDVLPYFIRSENATLQYADPFVHGTDGPLPVEDVPFRSAISYAHVRAAQEAGYQYVDYNSGDQIGVSFMQQSTRRGRRISAARAYLYPVRFRKNLHIATQSTVKKLIIDQEYDNGQLRVKGVVVRQLRSSHDVIVRARKEVILSAGAFESSKLLMLSGIGPARHLSELGVPLIKHLPVGQTLYEHMGVMGPVFTVTNANDGLVNLEDILTVKNFAQYIHGQGGPLTMNGVESLTYIKTNVSGNLDPGFPDVEIMQGFASLAFDSGGGTAAGLRLRNDLVEQIFKPLENTRAYFYLPMLLHPRSKGFMKLRSKNYLDLPIFEPNFFADPRDLETLVAGMEEAVRLTKQPSLQRLGIRTYTPPLPTCPHIEPGSHEYWRCWAQTISATFHHQVGTCKMGPEEDPTTVVDHTLRVHGFDNLRVADIGIIPQPPSGHTNAYSYMIGEKASDLVKETWSGRSSYDYRPVSTDYSLNLNFLDAGQQSGLHEYKEDVEGYEPKYFHFREKRSAQFDWQKGDSREGGEGAEKVQKENEGEVMMGGIEGLKGNGTSTTAPPKMIITSTSSTSIKSTLESGGEKRNSSDLLAILKPSEVDISHKVQVAPLPSVEDVDLPEDEAVSVDEDGIRTVDLDKDAQFEKGKNKPQIITEKLAQDVQTKVFEAKSFVADNSTRAVHLPVKHGVV